MGMDSQAPEKRVANAFNPYLKRIGLPVVRIGPEHVTLGSRRSWYELEDFWIAYRVDPDDGGFPSLELYVHHPMMDDWHARIWADGYLEELPAMRLWFAFDHMTEGSDEAARQELLEHNRGILIELQGRGLCPKDHVHGFRRSEDAPLVRAGELLGCPIAIAAPDWKSRP